MQKKRWGDSIKKWTGMGFAIISTRTVGDKTRWIGTADLCCPYVTRKCALHKKHSAKCSFSPISHSDKTELNLKTQ